MSAIQWQTKNLSVLKKLAAGPPQTESISLQWETVIVEASVGT